jgi:hypothetical protein
MPQLQNSFLMGSFLVPVGWVAGSRFVLGFAGSALLPLLSDELLSLVAGALGLVLGAVFPFSVSNVTVVLIAATTGEFARLEGLCAPACVGGNWSVQPG